MKIKLNLSDAGIKQAQKEYGEWRKTLETRIEQFVKRLSEMGVEVAKIRFTAAVYDGDMSDIAVQVEQHGKKATIYAYDEFGEMALRFSPYTYAQLESVIEQIKEDHHLLVVWGRTFAGRANSIQTRNLYVLDPE